MVMPKLPFSLFDFKRIVKFEPQFFVEEAAAGAALNYTMYTCPTHKFAWILKINIEVTKTTGTALNIDIVRKKAPKSEGWYESLFLETIGGENISWPSNKASAVNSPAYHIALLFPGDKIQIGHALTAAETIDHYGTYHIIEYNDPRYEKK